LFKALPCEIAKLEVLLVVLIVFAKAKFDVLKVNIPVKVKRLIDLKNRFFNIISISFLLA
jgi:hypothetical protein